MTTTVPRDVAATEIRWTLEPLAAPDLARIDPDDLLVSVLQDAEAYRLLAQAALGELAALTRRLDRSQETCRALRDEGRRYTAAAARGAA